MQNDKKYVIKKNIQFAWILLAIIFYIKFFFSNILITSMEAKSKICIPICHHYMILNSILLTIQTSSFIVRQYFPQF